MPVTWVAKLNVRVCQPAAVVTVASVSTDLAGSVLSSTFRRTGMPASGDHTRTDMRVSVVLNGIFVEKPRCTPPRVSVMVVPAKISAPAARTTRATLLAASVGSVTIVDASAPPKPTRP